VRKSKGFTGAVCAAVYALLIAGCGGDGDGGGGAGGPTANITPANAQDIAATAIAAGLQVEFITSPVFGGGTIISTPGSGYDTHFASRSSDTFKSLAGVTATQIVGPYETFTQLCKGTRAGNTGPARRATRAMPHRGVALVTV
jgi:hypothetical protein